MRRVCSLAIALVLTAVPAAQAQAPKLSILGQDTLAVAAKEGKDTADAYLSVLNPGDTPAKIKVAFQASSSDKIRVDNYSDEAGPGATRVKVTFGGLEMLEGDPVDGQIVVTGGSEPVARGASITPAPQPSANWPTVLFIVSGVAALVLAALVVLVSGLKGKLGELVGPAPGPDWAFDSWAANLTAAGAVFGTVLGAVTLPEVPREIDKDTLVQLNILFGVLLAVGPFLSHAVRRPFPDEDEVEAGLWGYSPVLLVSYALTGAAVVGEIGALALLGWELTSGGWHVLILIGAAMTALLAVYYFVVTAFEQVTTNWVQKAADAKEAARKPTRVVVVNNGNVEAAPLSAAGAGLRQMARMP